MLQYQGKEGAMRCAHCGDVIFVFEVIRRATNGETIHSFIVENGRLVCAPSEPYIVEEEEVSVEALQAS